MADEKILEIGNLTCRFGGEVLLDRLGDVVAPAFLDSALVRSYSSTSYFFLDVSVVDLGKIDGESYKGIAGRIVKDTSLVREQIYMPGEGLKKNRKKLKTAPSSLFVLILNNHRLLFLKEMADAPTMQSFRSTLIYFLNEKHKVLINSKFELIKEKEKGISWSEKTKKADLFKQLPRPTLEIVPLSSGSSISAFIDRYQKIKSLEFFFTDRNHELDDSGFYRALQQKQEKLGDAKLRFSDKEGLAKNAVKSEVVSATEAGNQKVKISGIDKGGDKLEGNNEDFKVKKQIDALVGSITSAAKNMFSSFKELVADKVIQNPKTDPSKKAVISSFSADE